MLSSLTKPIPPLPIPHSMVPNIYIYIYICMCFHQKAMVSGGCLFYIWEWESGFLVLLEEFPISYSFRQVPQVTTFFDHGNPWRINQGQDWIPWPSWWVRMQHLGEFWRAEDGWGPDSKWNYDFIPGLENAINIWVCNNLKCSKSLACFLRQTNAMKFHHLLREMVIKLLRFTASGRNHPAHPVIEDRNGKFPMSLDDAPLRLEFDQYYVRPFKMSKQLSAARSMGQSRLQMFCRSEEKTGGFSAFLIGSTAHTCGPKE